MRTKLIVSIIVMGLGIVGAFGWVGYQLFTTGFSAKTEPHALEVFIARPIRHLAMPGEKRNAQNPIPLSHDVIRESLVHFIRHLPELNAGRTRPDEGAQSKTKKDLEEEAAFGQFLQGDDAAAARTNSGHHH